MAAEAAPLGFAMSGYGAGAVGAFLQVTVSSYNLFAAGLWRGRGGDDRGACGVFGCTWAAAAAAALVIGAVLRGIKRWGCDATAAHSAPVLRACGSVSDVSAVCGMSMLGWGGGRWFGGGPNCPCLQSAESQPCLLQACMVGLGEHGGVGVGLQAHSVARGGGGETGGGRMQSCLMLGDSGRRHNVGERPSCFKAVRVGLTRRTCLLCIICTYRSKTHTADQANRPSSNVQDTHGKANPCFSVHTSVWEV